VLSICSTNPNISSKLGVQAEVLRLV